MTSNPTKQAKIIYSPAQASEILHLPASTIRRYSQQYGHLLSQSAGTAGRKRSYTPEDLNILQHIRDFTAQRIRTSEIESLLQVVATEAPPPPDVDVRLAPYIANQFEQFSAQFAQQDDKINQLLEEVKALREELQQAHKQSWWDRLRGKS